MVVGYGFSELLFAVVGLVRQAQTTLQEGQQVPIRIAGIVHRADIHEAADALALEETANLEQLLGALDIRNGVQEDSYRSSTTFFDHGFIHERAVEVGNAAGSIVRFCTGSNLLNSFGNDSMNGGFGLVAKLHEGTVDSLISWNGGCLEPLAIAMAVEIVLGTN